MSTAPGDDARVYPDGRDHEQQPQWFQDFPVDLAEDEELARREFAKFMLLTSGAFVAGQGWIVMRTQWRAPAAAPGQRLTSLATLPRGGVLEFRYPTEDDPCLLIHMDDGSLVAYGQQCSHLSCAVVPEPEQRRLHCPCHRGYFEMDQGRPIAGPPRRPLPRVLLEVRDGDVYAVGVELRTV